MNIKNKFLLFFVFLYFGFAKAQENKIQENRYDDIIEISNNIFQMKSKSYKNRKVIYVSIGNNKELYEYIVRQINKGKLMDKFENNKLLYNILFNEKELKYYKKQMLDGAFRFNKCDIETDSIFVFNKNRDVAAIWEGRLRRITKNNVEGMYVPFFTKNKKYAFTQISNIQGGGYIVYEKKNGQWVEIFYFGHYIS